MMPGMRVALVTWLDTHSDDAWGEVPKAYSPLIVKSVGYLIQHNDGVIVIPNLITAQEYSDEQQYGRSMIPRGCIQSIEYLEVKQAK